jgi:hypothetical protein
MHPLDPWIDFVEAGGWVAHDVMEQAGDVVTVTLAKVCHGRHITQRIPIRFIPFRRHIGGDAFHPLDGIKFRQLDFPRMCPTTHPSAG